MDDFISRKALLERLDNRTRTAYPNELYGLMLAHDYISDAPAVETGSKWIPVTERRPDESIPSQHYLCWYKGRVRILKYWRTQKRFESNGRVANVTHWMPLPGPPKESAEDG